MEKIRSAVIGCGRMGAFSSELMLKSGPSCWFPLSHIEALMGFDVISIEAICDVNISLLERAKSRYDVSHCYTDYNELFRNHKIDLLCVATRTIERELIIQTGVKHGVKAFHLEKPLCNSMNQLSRLESLITNNNICLSYGTLRRYLDIYQKARDIVDSGEFGKLLQIQINFGEGPLFWSHPHSVDLILFFAGDRELLSIQSNLSNVKVSNNNSVVSDPIIEQAIMYFKGGLVGSISKIPGMNVVLGCENGEITIESNGERIYIKKSLNDEPYFSHNAEPIIDNYQGYQGTFAAIDSLINNSRIMDYQKNNSVFLGQKILFGFVDSHINGGKIININEVSEEIEVLGKTGELFA